MNDHLREGFNWFVKFTHIRFFIENNKSVVYIYQTFSSEYDLFMIINYIHAYIHTDQMSLKLPLKKKYVDRTHLHYCNSHTFPYHLYFFFFWMTLIDQMDWSQCVLNFINIGETRMNSQYLYIHAYVRPCHFIENILHHKNVNVNTFFVIKIYMEVFFCFLVRSHIHSVCTSI